MATPRQVLAATRQWLKPVIFILLKCGVTWREFSELSKSVYVEIATRRFGKRGWPTNVRHTREPGFLKCGFSIPVPAM
jgi:hypothetical protein